MGVAIVKAPPKHLHGSCTCVDDVTDKPCAHVLNFNIYELRYYARFVDSAHCLVSRQQQIAQSELAYALLNHIAVD